MHPYEYYYLTRIYKRIWHNKQKSWRERQRCKKANIKVKGSACLRNI